MKLKHKTPCAECPWRKTSLKGYLGGNKPEVYADTVANNEVAECHMADGAMCAGSLSCAANACILPHKQHGGTEARNEVGKNPDVFTHPALFYEYHAGEKYTPYIIRMMKGGRA